MGIINPVPILTPCSMSFLVFVHMFSPPLGPDLPQPPAENKKYFARY
jgi:hypothetical protein